MGGLSHTVSGDIASFRTPSRVPIESLKFHFLPKQAAGTPTPENPIPIEGWTGVNGRRAGKNLFNYNKNNFALEDCINSSGNTINRQVYHTGFKNGVFTLSAHIKEGYSRPSYSLVNIGICKNGINAITQSFIGVTESDKTITLNSNQELILISTSDSLYTADNSFNKYDIQIEIGSNATDYEPYSEELIPITFPSNGKNLIDQSTYTFPDNTAVEIVDGVFKNKLTDTRSNLQLQVQLYDTPTHMVSSPTAINVFSTGRSALTFSVNFAGCSYLVLKHNGAKKDFKIMFPFNYGIGTYTVSVDVLSADPTTIGGVQLKNIQVELGDTATTYEPYSSDNTFYGGYIDPVAGEIVAEYAIDESNGNTWTVGSARAYQWHHNAGKESIYYSKNSICTHWINNKHTYFVQEETVEINQNGAFCIGKDFFTAAGFDYENLTSSQIEEYLTQQKNNGTPFKVCYPLATPIHIPLAPQQLQAFLDRNNFWSDANDITEVTYAVTESKDILATRKKAMAFDIGKHKKVKWNQWAKPLNADYWAAYDTNNVSVIFNDGIATSTWLTTKIGYNTSVKLKFNDSPQQIEGEVWYASYMINPSKDNLKWGIEICGGRQLTDDILKPANQWSQTSYITTASRTNRAIMYISNIKTTDGSEVGMTSQVKAPIYINLTQMFGLGNEPQTVAEFERICEINGIDLDTYQPYDEGSDRWLIIP